MKKILFSIIISSIFFTNSCYDSGNMAKVRINLGNIPIAGNAVKKTFMDRVFSFFVKDAVAASAPSTITKVYLAAYSGRTVTAVKGIDIADLAKDDSYNYAEFEVPAGKEITILVVGEMRTNGQGASVPPYAAYFGFSKTDLPAGEVVEVQITVYDESTWGESIAPNWNEQTNVLSWNSAGIPAKYKVYFYEYSSSNQTLYYDGYSTSIEAHSSINGCDHNIIQLEFEPFDLKTIGYSVYYGGC